MTSSEEEPCFTGDAPYPADLIGDFGFGFLSGLCVGVQVGGGEPLGVDGPRFGDFGRPLEMSFLSCFLCFFLLQMKCHKLDRSKSLVCAHSSA